MPNQRSFPVRIASMPVRRSFPAVRAWGGKPDEARNTGQHRHRAPHSLRFKTGGHDGVIARIAFTPDGVSPRILSVIALALFFASASLTAEATGTFSTAPPAMQIDVRQGTLLPEAKSLRLQDLPAASRDRSGDIFPQRIAASDGLVVEAESVGGQPRSSAEYKPLVNWLPIGGGAARKKGYFLPLPLGIGVNFAYMDQGITLSDLRLGFGNPSVQPSGVTFANARSKDMGGIVRFDAWILPVLDIYAIVGAAGGSAKIDVRVPALYIGPVRVMDPFVLHIEPDYYGFTYGGGLTLAAGYKFVFGVVDANYSVTDLNLVASSVEAVSVSPKLGIRLKSPSIPGEGAIWAGAMYMYYKMKIRDSIPLNQIDPTAAFILGDNLYYELEAEPLHPWNFVVGGQWEINDRWHVNVEAGFGNRKQVILGGLFRF